MSASTLSVELALDPRNSSTSHDSSDDAAVPASLKNGEEDYQSWRLEKVISATRMAHVAAIVSFSLVAPLFWLGWPQKMGAAALLIFGVAIPIALLALWVASRPRRRRWVMLVTALANVFAGLTGLCLSLLAASPAVIAGTTLISAFFGYNIYRLKPAYATAAVATYIAADAATLFHLLNIGRVDFSLVISQLAVILPGWSGALLASLGAERDLRSLYRSEKLVASQQQSLIEERANLCRFLSPEVTRLVRERGLAATLMQETLDLTVVCCDLRGFTHYTQLHGALRMAEVLRDYYAVVVEIAKGFDGTVKDFAGDGALILLGAPLSRPDHARAGLELARKLIDTLQKLTPCWSTVDAVLDVGAGIASGPCAVGAIGSQNRFEYTAIGPAVNLASRLCGKAGAGEILIDSSTAAAVTRLDNWRREDMSFKGFPQFVAVEIEQR